MKVATLITVSTPYFVTRFSAFTETCPNHSLHSIEIGRTSSIYSWKPNRTERSYARSVLTETTAEVEPVFKLVFTLFRTLNQIQPDVLAVAGYAHPVMIAALLWCIWKRKPAVIFSDSKQDDASRAWWKEWMKRVVLTQFQAALVAGKPHQQYLIQLGMQETAIFTGYDVVNNDAFHPSKIRELPNPLTQPFFLAVSRFVPKKNIFNLLAAYAHYCHQFGDQAWSLVVCGDGELRSDVESRIKQLGIEQRVYLPGFLEQEEMFPFFAHAQCFIHASVQEQWGLVVNEAMASGLPVLVSNRCGCFEDLVIEGVNGFGFDPNNIEQIATLMVNMSSAELDRSRLGQAALDHIQNFSPSQFAQGLQDAIEFAATQHQPFKTIAKPVSNFRGIS